MKDKEMQDHLVSLLTKFNLRKGLFNRLYIDVQTHLFRSDVSLNDRWDYYIWVCKELNIKERVMRSSGIDSEGGKKMKLDGHVNENLVAEELLKGVKKSIFSSVLLGDEVIEEILCDGINSKKVDSILSKKTTPKCDILVITNQRKIKLSVKKSKTGQVHLNKVNSFIGGYEKLFFPIPDIVKDSLLFLFSGHKNTIGILNDVKYKNENLKIHNLEIHHETLSVETMNKYNSELSDNLLSWFRNNISNITTIVFKCGWCKNEDDWVDYVLYRNKMNEGNSMNDIIDVNLLIERCGDLINQINFGEKNGGTTILLPFGSVQYHLGGMQFHHNRDKIRKIVG